MGHSFKLVQIRGMLSDAIISFKQYIFHCHTSIWTINIICDHLFFRFHLFSPHTELTRLGPFMGGGCLGSFLPEMLKCHIFCSFKLDTKPHFIEACWYNCCGVDRVGGMYKTNWYARKFFLFWAVFIELLCWNRKRRKKKLLIKSWCSDISIFDSYIP